MPLTRRSLLSASLATLLTVTLAACADSGTPAAPAEPLTQQENDLYTKAKSEPSLTWYSSQDPARNDAVLKAFQAKYPDLHATSFRLASGELANRYSQEHQSGVHTAGLVTLSSPDFVQQGQQKGWFDKLSADALPELKTYPADFYSDGVATTGISVFGIGYNTTLVQNPPKNWTDLLGPDYRGKIILGDPRNTPAYIALGTVWLQKYGENFLRGLAGQQPKLVDSMVPGTQQLAAGEGSIGLPSVLTVLSPLKSDGAPLDITVPDVTTGVEFQTMLPAGGPSPDTAKLLYQFLLTPAGQQAFNGTTSSSPVNAPGTVPLPANYQKVTLADAAKNRDQVLSLLGVQP
jgi:iron(III) transport system substrate-binding protein